MRKALTILCLLVFWLPCGAQVLRDGKIMISEKDKPELEQAFWEGLQVYVPKGLDLRVKNAKRIEKNLYVMENGWYETESVQNTAFFRKSLFLWLPVCESARPSESVMTQLTGHTGKKRYAVHLLQHRYKFGTAETEIPLPLLLEYCMSMGCTPYVGIESLAEGTIDATLFMVNPEAGFCHTFRFTIDQALLDEEEGMLQAEVYTFTPINNLKQ